MMRRLDRERGRLRVIRVALARAARRPLFLAKQRSSGREMRAAVRLLAVLILAAAGSAVAQENH
jgi:hypothetical protein